MNTALIVLTTVLLTAISGCGRDSKYPGSGLAPDESAAIGKIAYTRLVQEQACRKNASSTGSAEVQARIDVLRSATEREIQPSWCKSNIHPRQLDECISQIQRWPCDVALTKVTFIETCKVEPLCGVPAEGTL